MTATKDPHLVSFDCTREESATIIEIVKRARRQLPEIDGMDLRMDLAACHANGCPMDFERLLAADDFNFFHDVCGIQRHIDRRTGQLTDFFHPRFASRQS